MKRRHILGTIGIAVVPQVGAATGLYGAPASVTGPVWPDTELLRLPLPATRLPAATLSDVERYNQLWGAVFADAQTRSDFRRDPGKYLQNHHLAGTALNVNDQEVRLLQALTDDDVLTASMGGDYKAFLARLRDLGVVQPGYPSPLKRRLMDAMRQNLPEIQENARIFSENNATDPGVRDLLESSELRYLYSQLTPSIEQVAVAAVPVAIAAIVVAYVSVAVGVTVAILAGVYISIAVAVAVVANAECAIEPMESGRHYASAEAGPVLPSTGRSQRQREFDHAMAKRLLIGKRMLALDPQRLREAQVVSRTARLLNKDAFVLEANRQLLRDEVAAFVEAAEDIELIQVPAASRPQVIKAMEQIALRAAMLD